MSYDPLGISDAMLDSLSLQLREAEVRRAEAERAHQVGHVAAPLFLPPPFTCVHIYSDVCVYVQRTYTLVAGRLLIKLTISHY